MVLDKIPTSPFLEFVRFFVFGISQIILPYFLKQNKFTKSRKGCIVILYKSSSIRKNSWQLNHARVSREIGQKLLSRSNIDYATAVSLHRWRAKRPRRKLPSYSWLNSQEMPLSFKHIFAVIPYTMPLFLKASVYTWHGPNIHVSESNVYRRAIPAVMIFPGRLFFY